MWHALRYYGGLALLEALDFLRRIVEWCKESAEERERQDQWLRDHYPDIYWSRIQQEELDRFGW